MKLAAHLGMFSPKHRLAVFGAFLFFVFFADSMMAYTVPVYVAARVNNTFVMGLVISTSSMAGLLVDFLIPKISHKRNYYFFIKWMLYLAVLFPLVFLLLPEHYFSYILAMAIWGIYFEFIGFSQFSFINEMVAVNDHIKAWSVLEVFKSLGIIVGPFLASYLLDISVRQTFFVVVAGWAIAWLMSIILRKRVNKKQPILQLDTDGKVAAELQLQKNDKRDFSEQMKIWLVLLGRIWPVFIFYFFFILTETSLLIVGPLQAEFLKDIHWIGGALLSIYFLPHVFMPLLAPMLSQPWGKKRAAFILAGSGAAILACAGLLFGASLWFILLLFVAALLLSIVYAEINAVFEDYVDRVDDYANDMIALRNVAGSVAYILGPIVAGWLASIIGFGQTIGVFAAVLSVVSFVLLIVTPRKIRFSHQQLKQIEG